MRIRREDDVTFDIVKFEEIDTMDELEKFTEQLFIDNLGFVPFYMEVKPGFGQHSDEILSDLLVEADEKDKDDIQINLLAKTLLRRTVEFNKAFYPHLVNMPNGLFDTVCDYTTGKMEHPYIPGKLLETYDRGGNLGFVLYGENRNVIDKARSLQGSTGNPAEGTIRYKYGLRDAEGNIRPHKTANVVHCSDSCVSALKELYMAIATPFTWKGYTEVVDVNADYMSKLLDVTYLTLMTYGAITEKEQEILAMQNGQKQGKQGGKSTPAQKRLVKILEENKDKKPCPATEGIQKLITERKAEKVVNPSKSQDISGGEGR